MKYKVIEDDLLDKIKDGTYKVGDQIEQDTVLAKQYDSSELTVNRALTDLANRGYLRRIKGKGTYVTSSIGNDNDQTMKHLALTEHIKAQGMKPGARLIEYKIVKASENHNMAEEMGAEPDELFHYFVRVRTGDGKPICYSVCYMPVSQIPYLDVNILDNGSLWAFLGDTGFKGISRGYFKLSIVEAKKEIAKELDVEPGHKLLLSHHVSTLKGFKPYSYVDNYFVSERYDYEYQTNTIIQ